MQPSELPYWVQIASALGSAAVALVVGSIAAYLAYRQWKIANDKLRLDLFEKRYAVFVELKSILAEALQKADIEQGRVLKFYSAVRGAEFLFGPEVEAFIEHIYSELVVFNFHVSQVKAGLDGTLANGEDYQSHVAEKHRLMTELMQLLQTDVRSKFEPYLSFSHLK